MNTEALKALFSLEPYTWLVAGTHSTIYAAVDEITTKDDVNHHKTVYQGENTYRQIAELWTKFMPTTDWAALDVTVNGQDFALSTAIVLVDERPSIEFVAAARHRLTKNASSAFRSTVTVTM